MNRQAEHDIRRKTKVLEDAKQSGNVSHTCRRYGISRDTFYRWKRQYETLGPEALVNSKPCPENPKIRVPKIVEEKILYVRREFGLGQQRISWYLQRYYGLTVSSSGVYSVLKRNGLNRLPPGSPKRSPSTYKRYEKTVPGHQVQIDVKFLFFRDRAGRRIKRFQYTAIDDATRIRALKIYHKHTQANAIDFLDYVIGKFPFRIKYIHTDNGHEFQSKFHWHAEDCGIIHRYIKPASPHLNGKVERSHLTDKQEFYQLLNYTGDRNLGRQLTEWETFYNYHRPHTSLKGKTPYEILKSKLVA
jgi:transposase InsO family protein